MSLPNPNDPIIQMKLAKLAKLEEQAEQRRKFPHLHMHKWYKWSREFFEDWTSKKQIVTSANQVGKSASMIKKLIDMAINPDKWPEAWPELAATGQKPSQWWYLYPTKDVATVEFNEKWKMFLPQVPEDDPQYGWTVKKGSYATVHSIHFNTGVTIYFKAYKQDVMALQTGTAAVVACFVAGTLVETKRGLVPIESVTTEDLVLTRNGWSEVEKVFSREADVVSVPLSNKTTLTGTHDHLIWTETRGWVELACLDSSDLLLTKDICQSRLKRFLYLIRKLLLDIQTAKTIDSAIILIALAGNPFMSQSGSPSMAQSRLAMSFITLILTPLITVLIICSALLAQTIRLFIKLLSGRQKKKSLNLRPTTAFVVENPLILTRLKKCLCAIVPQSAQGKNSDGAKGVKSLIGSGVIDLIDSAPLLAQTLRRRFHLGLLHVKNVIPLLKAMAQSPGFALRNAVHLICKKQKNILVNSAGVLSSLIEKNLGFAQIAAQPCLEKASLERVYCLKSKAAPEFFANGILVHNCDEELPIGLISELQMRVNATNGFLFFVFTATMGQKFWREVVEERTKWLDAKVWQVSLYDSMVYTDGTPSMWTKERIEAAKRSCMNENEIQRRIMGRFVVDSGLLFPQFDEEKHVKPYHPLPAGWEVYAGVDYGTGGNAHPAAIVVCGVNPQHTQVRVIRAWRGDKQNTTAQDIVNEYLDITKGLNVSVAYYDYGPGGRDIGTIATRLGLPFEPADKGNETGRAIIASLLKNEAIAIYNADDEGLQQVLQTGKLVDEFITGVEKADKRSQRNDDLLDALRYCLSKIGFDWDAMTYGDKEPPKPKVLSVDDLRRQGYKEDEGEESLEEEFEFWQEQLEM